MKKISMFVIFAFCIAAGSAFCNELYPKIVKVMPQDFPNITTYVTFYDSTGNPVSEIEPIDFEIYEKVRIKPDRIYKLPVNLSVALLIDKSGSMRSQMKSVKQAAGNFLDMLTETDRVMVMAFDREYKFISGFTSNKWRAKEEINKLRGKGPTALYDTIVRAIVETDREANVQKAVVLITDGRDESRAGSRRLSKHSLRDVIDLSRKAEIPIYTIGLGSTCDVEALRKISYYSGGEYFHTPDEQGIMALYSEIARKIKYQYKVVYTSPIPNPDINIREISIKPVFGQKLYRVVEDHVPVKRTEFLITK